MKSIPITLLSSQAREGWAAPSLLLLRPRLGTMSASSATSARTPWSARDLFRMAITSSAPSVPRRRWWRRLRQNEQIRFDSILNSGFNSVHVWVHLTLRWRSIKRLFVLSLFGCGCVDNLIGYVSFQGRPSTLTPYDAMKLDMFIASWMLQNMFSPGLSRVSSNCL